MLDPLIELDFGLTTHFHKKNKLQERICLKKKKRKERKKEFVTSDPFDLDNTLPSKEKPF